MAVVEMAGEIPRLAICQAGDFSIYICSHIQKCTNVSPKVCAFILFT